MRKDIFFCIHSFVGLLSGVFIVLMSLSGAALVFHEELDGLQTPAIQAYPGKPLQSIDSCYRSLQKEFPHAQISSCSVAENTKQAFVFSVYDSSFQKGTQTMQVFMHPQTTAIIWHRGGGKDWQHNFMGWLTIFHNSFHLKKTGEWLLGFFAVVFLISILTGIILYRKKIIPVLGFNRYIFRKNNLHQIIGVYALLFNFMIGSTGFWMQRYVFKKEFYATEQTYTPVIKPSAPLFFNIDSSLQAAKKIYPAFTGYIIYFAANPSRKTAVYGSQHTNSFIHNKKFADAVFLDSMGRISKTAFVNKIPADNKRDIINAQIHYGRYGGLPIKILYSVLGLTAGILSITGFWLWMKRKRRTY